MPRAARHDAAQGPGGAASDNDAVVAAAGSASLPAGWSAGRRLLRYPFGSHPDGTQEGASGRNSQSRLFLAQATARAGFASLRLPTGGLASPQGASWRSTHTLG